MRYRFLIFIFLYLISNGCIAKYNDQMEIFYKAGSKHVGRLSILLPVRQRSNQLFFISAIGILDSNSSQEGDLGFGYRLLKNNQIFGAYVYYDLRKTAHNNIVNQLTSGLEYLRESFEFRVNGYLPIIKNKFILGTTKLNNQLTHNSSNVYLETSTTSIIETVSGGIDTEIGITSAKNKLNLFIGGYYFKGNSKKIIGSQVRLESKPLNWLTLSTEFKHDKIKNTSFYAGIGIQTAVGNKINNSASHILHRKMTQMPIRDIDIVQEILVDKIIQERHSFKLVSNEQELDRVIADDNARYIGITKDINFNGAHKTYKQKIKNKQIMGMKVTENGNNITSVKLEKVKLYNYVISQRDPSDPTIHIPCSIGTKTIETPIGLFKLIENTKLSHLIVAAWRAEANTQVCGGLVGRSLGESEVSHCENEANIIADRQAGLIALISGKGKVTNNINRGDLTKRRNGGLILSSYGDVIIARNYNFGKLTKTASDKSAGIVHEIHDNVKAINNINKAKMDGKDCAGIIGQAYDYAEVSKNKNFGDISGSYNSGILLEGQENVLVIGNKNYGKLFGFGNSGIIKDFSGDVKVRGNKNYGDIVGNFNSGIFINAKNRAQAQNNKNYGRIYGSRNSGIGTYAKNSALVKNNENKGFIGGDSNSGIIYKSQDNARTTENVNAANIFGTRCKAISIFDTNVHNVFNNKNYGGKDVYLHPERKISQNRQIQVMPHGRIEEQEVDAIVSPAIALGATGPGTIYHAIKVKAEHGSIGTIEDDLQPFIDSSGLKVEQAIVTPGRSLKSKYIIWGERPSRAAGGVVSDLERSKLGAFYRSCIEIAVQNKLKSIAFPNISIRQNYPIDVIADVGIKTANDLQVKYGYDIKVLFVPFYAAEKTSYDHVLNNL